MFSGLGGVAVSEIPDVKVKRPRADRSCQADSPTASLANVQDACFDHLNVQRGTGSAPLFDLRNITDFSVRGSRNLPDTLHAGPIVREKF